MGQANTGPSRLQSNGLGLSNDIGCRIDRDVKSGWLLDEGRPTLTLTYPQAGANSKPDRILIGMHDYGTGLDMPTFKVTADLIPFYFIGPMNANVLRVISVPEGGASPPGKS